MTDPYSRRLRLRKTPHCHPQQNQNREFGHDNDLEEIPWGYPSTTLANDNGGDNNTNDNGTAMDMLGLLQCGFKAFDSFSIQRMERQLEKHIIKVEDESLCKVFDTETEEDLFAFTDSEDDSGIVSQSNIQGMDSDDVFMEFQDEIPFLRDKVYCDR
jgi:hypothetical protein